MGGAHLLLMWLALSSISLQTSTSATSYLHVPHLNLSSEPDHMAIQTRTSSNKTKATKANASAVLRPCCNTRSTSRSPRDENVNAHLAKLNLPGLRFDGGLTVLGKEGQKEMDNPSALEVSTSKKIQEHSFPASPVGVKEGIEGPLPIKDMSPPEKQAQPIVKINKNPTSLPLQERPITSDDTTAPSSVL
jgi:hypothetical protein